MSDVTSVGSILNKTATMTGIVSMAGLMIIWHLANRGGMMDMMDAFTEYHYAYTGDVMGLVLTQLAAAYAIVKGIDSTVSTTLGFYYNYRGGSSLGDQVAIFELLFVSLQLSYAFTVSVVGYVCAALMWQLFTDRDNAAKNDGKYGHGLSYTDGYKFLALGFITGIGPWISLVALGDSSKELLGFFDNYNTKQEATVDGTTDADGTSL